MKTLSLILYFYFVGISAKAVVGNEKNIDSIQLDAKINNGMLGIASIAGVTRNGRIGRVSSVRAINFFPGSDSVNEYFYPLEFSSEKEQNYPLTVSTEKDGRYASGTVHVKPGYISASARAGYGNPKEPAVFNSPYAGFQRPFKEFLLQPPRDLFAPRNFNNWLLRDPFQGYQPPAPEIVRNGWLVPDFDPFINFWR